MIIYQIVYSAIALLIHYQILSLCLAIVIGHSIIKDRQNVKRVVYRIISFCLAIALLIGVPKGFIESKYPNEANVEKVTKGVTTWIQR